MNIKDKFIELVNESLSKKNLEGFYVTGIQEGGHLTVHFPDESERASRAIWSKSAERGSKDLQEFLGFSETESLQEMATIYAEELYLEYLIAFKKVPVEEAFSAAGWSDLKSGDR